MDIFYQHTFSVIGGIETFLYELAKKYSDRDLTIYYSFGDPEQIRRIRRFMRCIRYTGQRIKCDKAFFNYDLTIIDNVDANEYIQIFHADFRDKSLDGYPICTNGKINRYYAVSKVAQESIIALTGKECGIAYNPITIEKPEKIMHLISAQRLTCEKGGERIEKMVRMLDASGVNYEWKIFSNQRLNIKSSNVIYKEPTLEIRQHIFESDYMVVLSDTEGFCYGLYESLLLGTPVIATNIPVLSELGVIDGINGFIVDFDLSNIDIMKIYNNAGNMKFNYSQIPDIWGELLTKDKSDYAERLNMNYKVRANDNYNKLGIYDTQLNRIPESGEEFIITSERLDVLSGDNPYNVSFIEVIEEIKEEKPAKKTKASTKKTTTKKTDNK